MDETNEEKSESGSLIERNTETSSNSPLETKDKVSAYSIEDVIGDFGSYQCRLFFFLWFPASAMAMGVYASVYMEYTPQYQCLPTEGGQNQTRDFNPVSANNTCSSTTNTTCSSWVFDNSLFTSTVVTEWNLICDAEHLRTLSKTVYMSGMLFGSFFFGWFGDIFGRRASFAVTTVVIASGSIAAGIAPTFPIYVAARFLTSCGAMGLFITSFVLALEFVGTKYRSICGIAIEIPFALGELYIVMLAYFIRDWRTYQLVIGVPFILFLLYLIKLPESIRWLNSKGRSTQVMELVNIIAKTNRKVVPPQFEKTSVDNCKDDLGILTLVKNSILRRRLIIMALNWAVTTLGYYGLSLNSAQLSSNPFSSFALTAAMEIPSYIICMFTLDRFGRKVILASSQILAGTTCILAGCIPEDLQLIRLVLSLLGKFGASAGFAVVFVFTAELFPTPVRNSSIGLCSTLARVGGMLAPTVANLTVIHPSLPFAVMGSSCCLAGLAAFYLPETAGLPLPDTMDQACRLTLLDPEDQSSTEVEVEDVGVSDDKGQPLPLLL